MTKTSVEAWTALTDKYEGTNLDKMANIHDNYDHLSYVDGTSMRDYINKMTIHAGAFRFYGREDN
jgi:hypothetical protein